MSELPFWKTKTLAEMTEGEWESLCDGCGRCCLVKLEDEDTAEIYFTDVGCRLLDAQSCRCRDYQNRSAQVKDCVRFGCGTKVCRVVLPATETVSSIALTEAGSVAPARRMLAW